MLAIDLATTISHFLQSAWIASCDFDLWQRLESVCEQNLASQLKPAILRGISKHCLGCM